MKSVSNTTQTPTHDASAALAEANPPAVTTGVSTSKQTLSALPPSSTEVLGSTCCGCCDPKK